MSIDKATYDDLVPFMKEGAPATGRGKLYNRKACAPTAQNVDYDKLGQEVFRRMRRPMRYLVHLLSLRLPLHLVVQQMDAAGYFVKDGVRAMDDKVPLKIIQRECDPLTRTLRVDAALHWYRKNTAERINESFSPLMSPIGRMEMLQFILERAVNKEDWDLVLKVLSAAKTMGQDASKELAEKKKREQEREQPTEHSMLLKALKAATESEAGRARVPDIQSMIMSRSLSEPDDDGQSAAE